MNNNPRAQMISMIVAIIFFSSFVLAAVIFIIGLASNRTQNAQLTGTSTEAATTSSQ
jgi:hypothetical protein